MPLMRSWSQGQAKGKMLALAALVVGGKGGKCGKSGPTKEKDVPDRETFKRLRRMNTAVAEAVQSIQLGSFARESHM